MATDTVERKLATILAADVVGYSRLMGEDEEATHASFNACRDVIEDRIAVHHGRIFGGSGDSVIAEFASPVEAVRAAIEIQHKLEQRNAEFAEERRMRFRIGVNLGDVMADGDELFGDGVNVAARLEALAEPGGICISGPLLDQVEGKINCDFNDIGSRKLKNIQKAVQVYRVEMKEAKDRNYCKQTERSALPDKPSIAVLPFANLSTDSEREYFSDGISEDIITELSRFKDLFVIARNSSFFYKNKPIRSQDIATDLSVRYLLEGSVKAAGNRIRITTQLVDAATSHDIWAERYDRNVTDVFEIQDEIAKTVAIIVAGRLRNAAEKRVDRKPIENMEAYDYLLRGQSIVGDTEENNLQARLAFETALELDPTCARAYAGLAQHHIIDWFCHWEDSVEQSFDQALLCATKAVKLDDTDSKVQWMLGHIYAFGGEFEAAEAHLNRAVELNPNDADALCFMGALLSHTGKADESLVCFKKAMQLNPYHPSFYLWNLGVAYYNARRYEDALTPLKEFVDRHSQFMRPRRILAATYAQLGRVVEARAMVREILAVEPDASIRRELEVKQRQYKNRKDMDHLLDGLRKAGLPE